MLRCPYESDGTIPIPNVGEQIMGYALGELPMVVIRRLYHYLPEAIKVRLICRYPTADDYSSDEEPGTKTEL